MATGTRSFGRRSAARVFVVLSLAALDLVWGGLAARVEAEVTIGTRAAEVEGDVARERTFALPFAATHVALHWTGHPEAEVSVAFSADGAVFGAEEDAGRDEVGESRRDGETYGAVLRVEDAVAARVTSDRPIGRLSVLAMSDGPRTVHYRVTGPRGATAAVAQPPVIRRSGWGADESLRLDARGQEVWPPEFHAAQKLITHHTAGKNDDPDPHATIRSIYYYHAKTQGWGDIGYNFLIDESGRIYEGRYSRQYEPGRYPTGENNDVEKKVVTGGHSYSFNAGTVGVAFLGTLTTRDATPSARGAMEAFLAWKADRHGIDPQGFGTYTNPVNGTSKDIYNIAGHRDVSATECPGDYFYPTLPALRSAGKSRITAGNPDTSGDTTAPTAPRNLTATSQKGRVSLSWTGSTDLQDPTSEVPPSGLAGYEILRSTSAAGPFTRLTTSAATSYVDSGVTRNKTYWYQVRAYDARMNASGVSNTAMVRVR